MFWKKNALSYVFWLLYALVWGSMVVFSSLNFIMPLPMLGSLSIPVRMLVAIVPVLVIPVICIFVRRYIVRHYVHKEFKKTIWKIAELLVLLVIMGIGIWTRYCCVADVDIQIGVYSNALITEGSSIFYHSHGASYLYMQLLHGLFLLFVNKLIFAVWMQVTLFYIAGLFLYQGVKRVVGKLPALSLFALFILAPYFSALSIELSPLGIYLALYCFCLFYLTEVLRDIHTKPLQYFFGGLQVAVCIYLDFIGVTLVFWAILLLFINNNKSPVVEKWRICLITFLSGLIAGGVLVVVCDVLLTGRDVLQMLGTWWCQYMPEVTLGILEIAILIMGLLGIISFWFRRKTDRLCPILFLLFLVIVAACFDMHTQVMPYDCWIVVLLLLVAFIGFFDVFDLTDRTYFLIEQTSVMDTEVFECQEQEEEEAEAVAEMPVSNPVKLLENPLPVPKRHARRTMDYPITEIPEDDDFDIQITEDDDFDYKF